MRPALRLAGGKTGNIYNGMETLQDLIINYKDFLNEHLKKDDYTEIAFRIKKVPKTVYNYLREDGMAVDLLIMEGICKYGLEILKRNGITKETQTQPQN